ncbi:acyltransferase family protein, partial [Xenorhabdus bovienii]|uniref:acyltransferase family protein n=2 Tax=Xenorhabdus TaxID=626 RepID=UPI003DA65AFE
MINSVLIITISIIAWGSAFIFNKFYPQDIHQHGKYNSIDGLRGFLAILVFIHHSGIWFFYINNNEWDIPDSVLMNNIGKLGVSLFFMITA